MSHSKTFTTSTCLHIVNLKHINTHFCPLCNFGIIKYEKTPRRIHNCNWPPKTFAIVHLVNTYIHAHTCQTVSLWKVCHTSTKHTQQYHIDYVDTSCFHRSSLKKLFLTTESKFTQTVILSFIFHLIYLTHSEV